MVKFCDEICETIYDLVGRGYTIEQICAVCDISVQTFYNWKNKGEKAKKGKHKDFFNGLEKARSHRKEHFLDKLIEKTEDKDDWKGYAWLLEREFSDEYARPEVKVKQEIESKVEAEVKAEVKLSDLFDDEELNKILEEDDDDDDLYDIE